MRRGLRVRCNLEFSDQMVSEIMAKFDGGTGEIDFNKFANLVMNSSKDSKTGWTSPTKGGKNLGFDHFMMNRARKLAQDLWGRYPHKGPKSMGILGF